MTTTSPAAPPSGQRAEQIYPTLTPEQLARIAAHGRRRQVGRGEVLAARGVRYVVLLGSSQCQGTLLVREFLARYGHPQAMLDWDRDAGVQELVGRLHVAAADLPVVIACGEVVLKNPTNQQIAVD